MEKMPKEMGPLLENYRQLIARVDEISGRVTRGLAEHITCSAGCSGCCRHIAVFPVEAAALTEAVEQLPPEMKTRLREQAAESDAEGECPALVDGLCTIYPSRPLICRTHGLPLLLSRDGKRQVDYCPLNFRSVERLPGDLVLDLDRLNEALVSVNALFVKQASPGHDERASIAQILLACT